MAKRNEEPAASAPPTGEILEADADIFCLTSKGLESHIHIRGTNSATVMAESKIAIQSILETGGTARP